MLKVENTAVHVIGNSSELADGPAPPAGGPEEFLDAAFLIASALIFLLYHLWYYSWRFSKVVEGQGFHRMDVTGQRAREIFVRSVVVGGGPTEANLGIQIARNNVTAASILATGTTVGTTTLISMLTDQTKMDYIRSLEKSDPFTRASTLFPPEMKIGMACLALFLSFMSLVQSLRLLVHFGYFVRAASYVRENPDMYSDESGEGLFRDACRTCLRGQTFFSLGLRFLYAFVPLLIWLWGGTYLLVSTFFVVLCLFEIDRI